ncbi:MULTISPECIES: TRAP transporter small permease [unclassified Lysinibacillus]|uniref:TRAP transporter small permease n=1 Tax=unclassified Lysinibacillus TaxID=2636778 RepID=UPI002012E758|nr:MULTISPECIES: TRAP transporter small permease [unclassified Lysinibacillus]MCL1695323.1 TRAP transporter small permease [Lysinibacillus sp. BPa_S21]MCL1700997.1 TRAP transporter small permease [Lysinibacillus sp. Bpr_S20]
MKALHKVWGYLEEILAGTFFVAGVSLIFYGVIMRYIFNEPQAWVEELARYSIIWGTFFGFGLALRHNQHIQVDILYDKLKPSMKRVLDLVATGLSIVFCLIYTYYGFILVENRYTSGMISLDIGIPMWIVYLVLPISGALFLLRFVERLVNILRGKDEEYANPLT